VRAVTHQLVLLQFEPADLLAQQRVTLTLAANLGAQAGQQLLARPESTSQSRSGSINLLTPAPRLPLRIGPEVKRGCKLKDAKAPQLTVRDPEDLRAKPSRAASTAMMAETPMAAWPT
jgi:hypothetical protein